MKKTIVLAILVLLSYASFGQKSKLNVNRLEHIYYMEGLGGNHLYHSYGYEMRVNVNPWMKIQAGTGMSLFMLELFGFIANGEIAPNLSLQFGKNWLWTEIGFQTNIFFDNITADDYSVGLFGGKKETKTGNTYLSPRIGLHFKFARSFEFGVNYTPLFHKNAHSTVNKNYVFEKHWLSVRLRFVMVSKKRKRELGKWKLGFRNDLPFELYPEKKPSKRRIKHEELKERYKELKQKRIDKRKESKR